MKKIIYLLIITSCMSCASVLRNGWEAKFNDRIMFHNGYDTMLIYHDFFFINDISYLLNWYEQTPTHYVWTFSTGNKSYMSTLNKSTGEMIWMRRNGDIYAKFADSLSFKIIPLNELQSTDPKTSAAIDRRYDQRYAYKRRDPQSQNESRRH